MQEVAAHTAFIPMLQLALAALAAAGAAAAGAAAGDKVSLTPCGGNSLRVRVSPSLPPAARAQAVPVQGRPELLAVEEGDEGRAVPGLALH